MHPIRKLGLMFPAVLLTALSALSNAQELSTDKLKFSGTGRMRFENQEFTDALVGSSNFTSVRLRPNFTYKADQQLELVFEPQFAKRMGAETYTPGDTGNTLGETSGNSAYSGDVATVYQGYMNLKFNSQLSLKGGRQALKYGDELILGPSNWGLYGRSFDAATLRWAHGESFVDFIYAKVVDFGVRSAGGDRNLYGVYSSWNFGFWLKSADVYLLTRDDRDNRDTDGTGPDNGKKNQYHVMGGRANLEIGSLALKAEYAKGDGSHNYVGNGADADMYVAAISHPIGDKHDIALEYDHAGKNWNDLYPTTNRVLGRTDVLGRRNLEAIALHWSSEFTDSLSLEFDYYNFWRASTNAKAYKTNSYTSFGSATSTSKDLGQELDLAVKFKQTSSITWSASYSIFLPGSYLEKSLEDLNVSSSRKPAFYYVMLETKF